MDETQRLQLQIDGLVSSVGDINQHLQNFNNMQIEHAKMAGQLMARIIALEAKCVKLK